MEYLYSIAWKTGKAKKEGLTNEFLKWSDLIILATARLQEHAYAYLYIKDATYWKFGF